MSKPVFSNQSQPSTHALDVCCPHCHQSFTVSDGVLARLSQAARAEAQAQMQNEIREGEMRLRTQLIEQQAASARTQAELEAQLAAEKQQVEATLQTRELQLRKQLSQEIRDSQAQQLAIAHQTHQLQVEQLKQQLVQSQQQQMEMRKDYLALLDEQQRLKTDREQMEVEVRKRAAAIANEKSAAVREEMQLALKEKESQIAAMQKQAVELQKKAEQSSQQRQGEAQELLLESALRERFPADEVEEIKKGANGADVALHVNANGHGSGTILIESKRTKTFGSAWIEKLKADGERAGADVLLLVSEAMPKDKPKAHICNDVWVCSLREFPVLIAALREQLIAVSREAAKRKLNDDQRTQLLNYITSDAHKSRMSSLLAVHEKLLAQIASERNSFSRQWKAREKELGKMLDTLSAIDIDITTALDSFVFSL